MNMQEWERVKSITHKYPEDVLGERVRIHWHFQYKKYSVSVWVPKRGWRCLYNPDVLDVYSTYNPNEGYQTLFGKVVLQDAWFNVQLAGARKAYETGKRNVHATVTGTLLRYNREREIAHVPCGRPVLYSHVLYPEPEFKVQDKNPCGIPIRDWQGIKFAEFLACGVNPDTLKPIMLAAGRLEYT